MTHACWLFLTVVHKDCEQDWQRRADLPFTPHKGMCLQWDDGDDPHQDFEAHRVVYLPPFKTWWCFGLVCPGADACPCKPKEDCCRGNDEHREWMRQGGWEFVSERRGTERHRTFPGMFGRRPKFAIPLNGDE